jgi:hypothetical protein
VQIHCGSERDDEEKLVPEIRVLCKSNKPPRMITLEEGKQGSRKKGSKKQQAEERIGRKKGRIGETGQVKKKASEEVRSVKRHRKTSFHFF